MKGLLLLVIVSLLLAVSSCNRIEAKEELNLDEDVKQIIFFSDDTKYENEASYYDAIIELKKQFPNEIKNMKIITANNAKKYYNTFDIQECPAILLVYQEKVLVKINGNASKEQIVKPFTKALEK